MSDKVEAYIAQLAGKDVAKQAAAAEALAQLGPDAQPAAVGAGPSLRQRRRFGARVGHFGTRRTWTAAGRASCEI